MLWWGSLLIPEGGCWNLGPSGKQCNLLLIFLPPRAPPLSSLFKAHLSVDGGGLSVGKTFRKEVSGAWEQRSCLSMDPGDNVLDICPHFSQRSSTVVSICDLGLILGLLRLFWFLNCCQPPLEWKRHHSSVIKRFHRQVSSNHTRLHS